MNITFKFHKSRVYAFLRAVLTSPLCEHTTLFVCSGILMPVAFLSLVIGIPYMIYLFVTYIHSINVLLVENGTLYNFNVSIDDSAVYWMIIEIFLLIFIAFVCALWNQTCTHITKEMDKYELEMIEVNK